MAVYSWSIMRIFHSKRLVDRRPMESDLPTSLASDGQAGHILPPQDWSGTWRYWTRFALAKSLAARQRDTEKMRLQHHLGVSINGGTSKSSILVGFSRINHPFSGTLMTMETPPFGDSFIRKRPAGEISYHVVVWTLTLLCRKDFSPGFWDKNTK